MIQSDKEYDDITSQIHTRQGMYLCMYMYAAYKIPSKQSEGIERHETNRLVLHLEIQ